MSLRLSKEHGVNPCIPECYICGKGKNEIILTGHAGERMAKELGRQDGQMPMQAVFDIEPCDECKAVGVAFVEMTKEGPGAKPTGRRCLIKDEAVRRAVQPQELLDQILAKRITLLSVKTWEQFGLPGSKEAA